MKIAIPTAGNQLCTHFGHCEKFQFFDVNPETGDILNEETMTAPPHEPGLLPRLLSEKGANVVIAGGMGAKAQSLFRQNGVKVVTGADPSTGSLRDIVKLFMSGELRTGKNMCDH